MRISNSGVANNSKKKPNHQHNITVMHYLNLVRQKYFAGIILMSLFIIPNMGYAQPCDGMKCNSFVQLSLDEYCSATVTAGMLLAEMPFSESDYIVKLYDALGTEVPNVVGINEIDKSFQAKVIAIPCGNNTCWTDLKVEYKLPPQIDCPSNLTVSCGALDILTAPAATASCAGLDFSVVLHNEVKFRLDCDTLYTHRILRTYRATDERGNYDQCTYEILLKRVDLDSIEFPEWRTVLNGNPISCKEEGYLFDQKGFPLPWLNSSFSGLGTSGVPFICDTTVTNGVFCPATGSGSGSPFIPGSGATTIDSLGNVVLIEGAASQFCNSAIFYTDIDRTVSSCLKKVLRQWEIREWWCSGESMANGLQMIEVLDDEAPEFNCPPNFTVTTNDDCAGSVVLDPVVAVDACDNEVHVTIDFPNGFLYTNGGVAELDTGINVIKYLVTDKCLNSRECTMNVTVKDETEPVAICDRNTVVSIGPSGRTLVYAEVFDDGTWDECSLDKFVVRRMDTMCIAADTLFGNDVSFCCADVGNDVRVVFRAYDRAGNHNECMVNVEVQDKVVAFMTCPEDKFIDCRASYDLNKLGLIFGEPDIIDNCAATQIVVETVNSDDIDQCGIGKIIRLFELMDGSGNFVEKSCKQVINVSNDMPFSMTDIDWPDNYNQPNNGCGTESLNPSLLPVGFGYPIFLSGDDQCSLLGWDYEDKLIDLGEIGLCARVERSWTVINWCGATNGSFEIFEMPYPQILEVRSVLKPSIEAQDSILIESINVDCESGRIVIERTATDNCSPEKLKWSYVVRDDMNAIVTSGETSTYTDTLISGVYSIEWSVVNVCNQSDHTTQIVTILNKKAPTPVCLSSFNAHVSLNSPIEFWASDIDAGSYHTCDNNIALSFDKEGLIQVQEYSCDDVGTRGVQLWVTDVVTGVQDFCTSTITVIGDSSCPMNGNMADVHGEIHTEMLEQIEGVEVVLEGGELQYMTEDDGQYAFDNMPLGGDYIVRPAKNIDFLNGVSTLDLVLIQRHILGIQKLDSPYKIIAADINGNKEVSAVDLIQLRKLVLGIYEELPENKSWRFVNADYKFVDPVSPWTYDIEEDYEILNLNQNMNIDFIGVKIGDVNGSVTPNLKSESIDNRSARWSLDFTMSQVVSEANDIKTIAFTSPNYERVSGWQGTFEFSSTHIEIVDITPGVLGINANENINSKGLDQGWFTVSHYDYQAMDFASDEVLFTISYIEKGSYSPVEPFVITSNKTRSEAYRGTNEIVDLRISQAEKKEIAIMGARPNPWSDHTEIEFYVPSDGQVNWEFFDVNGRSLYQVNDHYSKGNHRLSLKSYDLKATGVIYVRMTSDYAQAEFKMMVIN